MTDADARELLGLLHDYVAEFGSKTPRTVADLASDLAMSMDVTTDEDDRMWVSIESVLG